MVIGLRMAIAKAFGFPRPFSVCQRCFHRQSIGSGVRCVVCGGVAVRVG